MIARTKETTELKDNLSQCISIVKEYDISSLLPQVNSLRGILNQTDKIYVAVLGRFKAGKSSFINNIVGRDLLPTGVLPVTAILMTIQYADENSVEIVFQDKNRKSISEKELSSFIAEKENPHNQKKIQEVQIHQASLKKYNGLVFVDTPGLGSIFTHNTQTTIESLPDVQLAIITISVDSPLSESDLSLLKEARRFTSDVHILVTKADLVSEEERAEIESFIKTETQKAFGESLLISFYSVRSEFKNLQQYFDEQVLLPLLNSKTDVHLRIVRHKFRTLHSDLTQYLNLCKAISEKTNSEAEKIVQNVLHEEAQIEFLKREISSIKKALLAKTRELLHKDLLSEYSKIVENTKKELRLKLVHSKGTLWTLTRLYEDFLQENIKSEMNSLIVAKQKTGKDYLSSAQISFIRLLEAFRNRVSQKLKDSLGIDFKISLPDIKLNLPEVEFIPFPRAFDTQIDILFFLFPMFLFKDLFVRHFLAAVPYEIEKNISRLASVWTDSVNSAIESLAIQTHSQIEDEMISLKKILTTKTADKNRIEISLQALKELKL